MTAAVPRAIPPLRIGAILPSHQVPRWIERVLLDITSAPWLELSLVVTTGSADAPPKPGGARHWLWNWYEAVDYRRFHGAGDDPLRQVDVSTLTAGRLSSLDRLEETGLDVLLAFDHRFFDLRRAKWAKFGVWAVHHGENGYRGGPPLFWEMYSRIAHTASVLEVLRADSGSTQEIYRSVGATNFLSLHVNRRAVYWKSADVIMRRLRDLHRDGWAYVSARATPINGGAPATIARTPTNRQMLRFFARTCARWVSAKAREHSINRWTVAFRRTGENAPFTMLEPPPGHFYADPCLAESGSETFLLFEDYSFASAKGVIACVQLQDGKVTPVDTVFESDCHLSYPLLFRWCDAWWMVLSIADRRSVELYRADDFPRDWKRAAVLLHGIDARDSTICEVFGRWWMFVTVRLPGGAVADEVSLYHASTPLGPWHPHRHNPIVSDVRRARPAGAVYRDGADLIRPAQNCSRGYGYAITLNRIDRLTEDEYAETPVDSIWPDWHPSVRATHTIGRTATYEALDGRVSRLPSLIPTRRVDA